ncbi:MAG: hypothetical protein DHS80DRAFT_25744 [Piptocephalis tieghemiana]|nr:MAG: hypothetical protein DHS80DRAFT_25744 [Piptocephalis tieghemiana]
MSSKLQGSYLFASDVPLILPARVKTPEPTNLTSLGLPYRYLDEATPIPIIPPAIDIHDLTQEEEAIRAEEEYAGAKEGRRLAQEAIRERQRLAKVRRAPGFTGPNGPILQPERSSSSSNPPPPLDPLFQEESGPTKGFSPPTSSSSSSSSLSLPSSSSPSSSANPSEGSDDLDKYRRELDALEKCMTTMDLTTTLSSQPSPHLPLPPSPQPPPSSTSTSSPLVPTISKAEENLVEMGFDLQSVRQALEKSQGDMERATHLLLDGSM